MMHKIAGNKVYIIMICVDDLLVIAMKQETEKLKTITRFGKILLGKHIKCDQYGLVVNVCVLCEEL